MNRREMRRHIRQLCEQYHIKRVWTKSTFSAYAFPYNKTIQIPPIKSHITYAIALHEIGHLVNKSPNEIRAWKWAMKNSLVWNTTMENTKTKCLKTYDLI